MASTTEVLVLPLCGRESEPVQNKRVSRRQGKTIQTRKGRPTTSSISTRVLTDTALPQKLDAFCDGDKALRNTWRRGLGWLRSTAKKRVQQSSTPRESRPRVGAAGWGQRELSLLHDDSSPMREKALRVMKTQFYTAPSLSGDRVCMHVHSKFVEHTLRQKMPKCWRDLLGRRFALSKT